MRLPLLAAALLAAVSTARGEFNPLLKLDYALRLGNARALPSPETLKAISAKPEGETARALLLHVFDQRWLSNSEGKLGLPLFEQAAEPFTIFGPGNQALPAKLTAKGSLPNASEDGDFLAFLKRKLPANSVRDELLKKFGDVPSGSPAVVANFRFLQDVARDAEADAVATHFQTTFWDKATPADAAAYHPALAAVQRPSWTAIRKRLGLRVFNDLEVKDWPGAGKTLLNLAEDSGRGIPAFLTKAAIALRDHPALRSGTTGSLLEMLVGACDADAAATALGLTNEACDVEWFIWCHDQSGIIDHLLGNATAARSLTARLIRFCLPDDDSVFSRLFPMLRTQYYEREKFPASLQDTLFTDLLSPKSARGEKGGALVLDAAFHGAWRHDHRHTLATMIFRGGEPDSPAWKGAGTTRLAFSDGVYQHLLDDLSSPDVQAHVERELLGLLLNEYLRRFKVASDVTNEPTAMDKAEREFKPLLDHLSDCRRRNADLSQSSRLRQFKKSLAEATLEVLAALQPGSSDPTTVQRFVRRFKMALRVDRLVQPLTDSASPVPEWVKDVTQGMRKRVFDLPDSLTGESVLQPHGPIIRWADDVLAFRVRVLVDITMDKDFREVLAGSSLEEHVFEELLLPLVRVHGVLALLCPKQGQLDWPHAAWSKGQPKRLAQLFRALDSAESLDCFAAVCVIAELTHGNTWRTAPAKIFTGVWSINADLLVLRWLLEAHQPEAADTKTGASDLKGLTALAVTHWKDEPTSAEAWERAVWFEHILTAGEWQAFPFQIDAKPTEWENPVLPLEGRKPALPFHFVPSEAQMDSSRVVDGGLRLLIVNRLIKLLDGTSEPARIEFVTNAAALLPNSSLNDASNKAGQSFDEPKLALLKSIAQRVQVETESTKAVTLLQAYLRLGAALSVPAGVRDNPRGGLPAELPSPIELIAIVLSAHPPLAVELGSLREELRRLLLSRERRSHGGTLAMLREQLDAVLGHGETGGTLLTDPWTGSDRDLLSRDYGERLKQVGEGTVRDFLRVRRDLLLLLKSAAKGLDAEDSMRVQRFFGWIDWLLFFSRPDWKSGNGYLALHAPDSQGKEWWPALALLCAGTPALQDACQHDDRPLMLNLFRLNEATLGALDAVMAEADEAKRKAMLDFESELFWTELHLGILARTEHHDIADAHTLAENAFHGAVKNLAIATQLQKAPSDQTVDDRLFKTLDSSLGNDRRGEPIISLDGAVRLAAACAEDESLPEPVRTAAPTMLRAAAEAGEAGLLGGAATPGKVMDLLFKLHDAALEEKSEFWRSFYDKALTSADAEGKLAPSFRKALAQPFFRQALPGQRAGISSVVERWRGVAGKDAPKNGCALTSACRAGWGLVIDDLLNGEGREDKEAPFLWQTVTEFEKAGHDILKDPPAEFLTLTSWLIGFWNDTDPAEVKAYFNPAQEVAQP